MHQVALALALRDWTFLLDLTDSAKARSRHQQPRPKHHSRIAASHRHRDHRTLPEDLEQHILAHQLSDGDASARGIIPDRFTDGNARP